MPYGCNLAIHINNGQAAVLLLLELLKREVGYGGNRNKLPSDARDATRVRNMQEGHAIEAEADVVLRRSLCA